LHVDIFVTIHDMILLIFQHLCTFIGIISKYVII